MSELTTEQVLDMIERNGGPKGLDLSQRDLTGIDLGPERIQKLLTGRPSPVRLVSPYEILLPESWTPLPVGINLGGANLKGAKLNNANLSGANLRAANLDGAEMTLANLEYAVLWQASLVNAKLPMAHCHGAGFHWSNLTRAEFRGAYLKSAHFLGSNMTAANLEIAILEDAVLRQCDLHEASFENATLVRTDFLGANLTAARWKGARIEQIRITRSQFGREIGDETVAKSGIEGGYHEAQEVYLALKSAFQSLGRYEDAAWAYVKERQMERKSFFPSEAGDPWLAQVTSKRPGWLKALIRPLLWLRLLLRPRTPQGVHLDRPKWLRDLFWEGLALYGESIWRPFLWGAGIIAVWSLLFALVGVEGAQDGTDYLVFSLRSFATMAFNDLQPGNLAAKLLSAVEAMLGVSTLALVMYCLGRRMSGS